jgi:membrane protease YdiL (CAAX protease family)
MPTSISQHSPRLPRSTRLLAHPLSRIVIASLIVLLPVALTLILVQHTLDKSMRQFWPQLLSAALCIAAYVMYVQKVEKREVVELSRVGAGREFGLGVSVGVAAIFVVLCMMMATGAFAIVDVSQWTALVSPFSEMILVAFLEEILFRAIIFRIVEKSLGTIASLLISAILFALAHLPNAGISLLGIAVTAVAGLMFCAAYMVTRRLWLAVGIHFAWNFMFDAVFSLPTSGHQAKGFLQGQLSGPEWLSGGAYGIEASVVTLVVLSILTLWLLKIANWQEQTIPRRAAI